MPRQRKPITGPPQSVPRGPNSGRVAGTRDHHLRAGSPPPAARAPRVVSLTPRTWTLPAYLTSRLTASMRLGDSRSLYQCLYFSLVSLYSSLFLFAPLYHFGFSGQVLSARRQKAGEGRIKAPYEGGYNVFSVTQRQRPRASMASTALTNYPLHPEPALPKQVEPGGQKPAARKP